MINVTITENGSIRMTCTKCGYKTTVSIGWAGTPFWETFAGQSVLIMLGHLRKEHDVSN